MSDATGAGMRAAARSLAATMRSVAGRYTRRGAAAVNVSQSGDGIVVRAGAPTGQWGWTPINAWELDNNGRHPFYGDRKRWYSENNKKHGGADGLITEQTAETGADAAASAFADAFLAEIFS